MARAEILEKYADVIAESAKRRYALRTGTIDEVDIIQRRRRSLRVTVGLAALLGRGRFDVSRWASIVADLTDDGMPDWTYWLDKPERRYRLRPWREIDGNPWSYQTPCVTVLDGEAGASLRGIPAGAFLLRGQYIKLEDTDACCAALFANARIRKRAA
jgi:hypothetical protein